MFFVCVYLPECVFMCGFCFVLGFFVRMCDCVCV